ncbi:conserved Plasmodium protein, unknown function [Plasmodium gallinaceum]|uniref:G domain-containing protein n=1 Tax=Plasmodium gallinaceum TaxID=5849 RepID=A0A1J1GRT9_PLAGA|nr:conserved Plasmodium protein, unknown function [Plasmodium gallinaceum]CRG95226.1 conserved Plasmodium protein, unknown function [Plasmodium gallinaceum]
MFLKIVIFLLINIFIYTKCNSYILKNNYFQNLFFINNINSLYNSRECKTFRNKKLVLKSNKKRKKEKSFNKCFLLNKKHCGIYWKYKTKKWKILSNFDKIFKESFNEDDRLKKSELISILACICTNIVIEYLKIKEEKKNENFQYTFDYDVMNILKMVNFEYDVNEEIKKKKKKSYKKEKAKKNIPNCKLNKEYFINNEEEVYKESEELNINIDNKNSKEENEELDKYIKKIENNTMEISEINHYIDLFFGKNTYNNIFVKFNIDIYKIYNILNSVLFEKSKEKENVMQLQKFVEQEENKLYKKKINVRNVNSFNDYLDKFNSLEEQKNINEIENILYDDDTPKCFKTSKRKKNSGFNKKSNLKKNKNKMNGRNFQHIIANEEEKNDENNRDNQDDDQDNNDENNRDNQDDDQDNNDENNRDNQDNYQDYNNENNRDNQDDDQYNNNENNRDNQDINYQNGDNNRDNQDNDKYNNDENNRDNQDYDQYNNNENNRDNQDYDQYNNNENNRDNQDNNCQNGDNIINGNINEYKVNEENNMYENSNHKNDKNKNFSNENDYEKHKDNHENKRGFLNSISYALIKKNNIENDNDEEKKEGKNNIILIKFFYENIYKCEFRTDIGVIVYDSGMHNFIDEIKIKDVNMDNKYLNKDKINIEDFVNNMNFEKLCSLPYKKRFYKKQSIIKEINNKIDFNNLHDEYLSSLLYIYLKIWGDDLHFYELKKVDIKYFNKEKDELEYNKKDNFLINYDEKKNMLIDSDLYNQIIHKNTGEKKKYFYNLFDDTFLSNDYISFNLKLFINNKKEINNYDTLMNTLKLYNSSLSRSIQYYLSTINEHNFSFVSSEEFLKNYIYNENDEFFNFKKILHKCKTESKYIHLFLNSKKKKKNNKNFKLFCFHETSFMSRNFFFLKRKYNIFENKIYNKFLGDIKNYSISVYSKKKKRIENGCENFIFDPVDELEEELINFEEINNILDLKGEKNEMNTNETKLNDNTLPLKNISKKEEEENNLNVINSSKNIYIEKMIEKQKKTNDFLNLVKLNEDVKKNLNIVNYEEALKYFKEELKNKQKQKGKTSETNNVNNEDERDNEIKDKEIDRYINLILENKNNNIINKENDEIKDDKLNKEKEKVEDFFKSMDVKVKLSKNTCVGCGIMFQSTYKDKFGFLKNHIYEKVVNKDEDLDKKKLLHDIYDEHKENQDDLINYKNKLNEFFSFRGENINNIFENNKNSNNDKTNINDNRENENIHFYDLNKNSILKESYEEEDNNENPYICERCFNLKYKNKIYNNLIVNYTNNNEISAHDFEKYVINIFKKRCCIIYIVDILDLYVYSNLNKLYNIYKKIHYDKGKVEGFYFCVNKIDLLKDYKEFTIKNYIYSFLKSNKINVLFKNIFLVSAKTGYNVKKLIYTVYMNSKKVIKKKKKNNNNEKLIKRNETNEYNTNDLKEEENDFENPIGYDEEKENSKDFMKKNNKKNYGVKNLNIYIVGNANSGKSSLINYLLKNIKKKEKNFSISNSIIPGTTLKNIQIKLNKNLTINDTPGIISNNSILSHLNFEELKYVVCTKLKKKIPSMYINENDYIFVGGILYIHILNIQKYYSIISFFISDKIPVIKRKKFSKDPNVFLREKIKSGFLYPPFSVERFDEINDFKKYYFNLNNTNNDSDNSSYDIHIQGMGYITFYSFRSIEFNLYTLKNVEVVSRSSLLPYHKKYGNLDFSKKML